MAKEIEMKILDVNKTQVVSRLKAIGAKRIGVFNFKRLIFLVRKDKKMISWLRIRTDGKKSTITLKEQLGTGLTQTEEYETMIGDFKTVAKILCKVYKKPVYEENQRILYSFDGAEITIDKWPEIPWLVEIEAKSEKEVMRIQKLLKIKGRPVGNINANQAYEHYGLDFLEIARRNDKKLAELIK